MNILTYTNEYTNAIDYPIMGQDILKLSHDWALPESIATSLRSLPNTMYTNESELVAQLQMLTTEDIPEDDIDDDGIPKRRSSFETGETGTADDLMDNSVNPNEFVQMGDEEDHESV